ncbi:unnamed protein product [Schistosoma margrebowiei]|uniref:Uncharacterized protein n=1 Tax=Schistosoma margrebowiei TaxID=48269 RepID=A0A3P7XWU4_9TREM|nr:unnamed protein product [Schistosoma margrebowiei]
MIHLLYLVHEILNLDLILHVHYQYNVVHHTLIYNQVHIDMCNHQVYFHKFHNLDHMV